MNITTDIIQFELPKNLACPKPTEQRNIARDEVRLLVTSEEGVVDHTEFKNLADYLNKGDVLVVNTSATQPVAFPTVLPYDRKGVIHLSTRINEREWLVEIRELIDNRNVRWNEGMKNLIFRLPGNASLHLKGDYYNDRELLNLWVAKLDVPGDFQSYISEFGRPIQYENLNQSYPLNYYQTLFSVHPGSSEMPSAGRGFTQSLLDKLIEKGVIIAPILLHTGVSSLEENETPYPEYMELDKISAEAINIARKEGRRVVAVGTTAVRAVESTINERGHVVPYKGNTSLYITSDHEMKIVNGLITGFHEPKASHLHMLQSLAGFDHIENAYSVAIKEDYYWHQFGDLHLILV